MPPTPEQLARETGYTADHWTRAKDITGPLWHLVWRPIAKIAAVTGATPAAVAADVVDLAKASAALRLLQSPSTQGDEPLAAGWGR